MLSINRIATLIVVCLLNALTVFADDLTVIANSSVPEDTLRSKELRDIYYGRRTRWSDGTPLIPVTLRSRPIQDHFLESVLKRTSSQFESFWRQALFTGEGIPPRSFGSEAELRTYVERTPGALGFIQHVPDSLQAKTLVIIE